MDINVLLSSLSMILSTPENLKLCLDTNTSRLPLQLLDLDIVTESFQHYCIVERDSHIATISFITAILHKYITHLEGNNDPIPLPLDYKKISYDLSNGSSITVKRFKYYYEIDCLPWSITERNCMHEVLKQITRCIPIWGTKHVIVVRNIHEMSVSMLQQLRCILEERIDNAQLVLTTRNASYSTIHLRGITQNVRLKISYEKLLPLLTRHFNKGELVSVDIEQCRSVIELALLAAKCTKKTDKPLAKYISSQFIKISSYKEIVQKYNVIHDTVNVLMTSDVPFKSIATTVLDICTALDTNIKFDMYNIYSKLAHCDVTIIQQNKIQYGLEELLLEIADIIGPQLGNSIQQTFD
jgi:hypothetical protein